MAKKKKKKKKRRMEEELKATEPGGVPGAGLEGSPGGESLAPPTPEEQPPATEEPTASDQPPEDVPAPSDRPGLLTRFTSWLSGGSEPAAAGAEPKPEVTPEPVEETARSTEPKEGAIPAAEEAAEPFSPAPEGEDLRAKVARLAEELEQKDRDLQGLRGQRDDLHGRLQGAEERVKELERQLEEGAAEAPSSLNAKLEQQGQEIEKLRGEKAEAESRVQALEAQLQEQTQPSQDLQKRVEELTRQLDSKDAELERMQSQSQETAQAREEAKRALSRLRDMEAALKQAEERTRELQAEIRAQEDLLDKAQMEKSQVPSAAPPGEPSPGSLEGQAAELYQQAVTPLTVLVASADLLVMDPGLDPGLRETASEMKAQSQALLELIKRYAGPQGSS